MEDKTDICSAIEKAGAVEIVSNEETYAFAKLDENGCLVWYDKKTKEKTGSVVTLAAIRKDIWKPYREEKEIKPEMQGEVWETKAGFKVFVCRDDGADLVLKREDGYTFSMNNLPDGLKRLFPKVEDDSVETIEIEGVVCKEDSECVYTIETTFTAPQDLANKPMKMSLEVSKI